MISIPPPNVTGELHLGHAMFVSMEDLMIRYQRMKGVPTLWVPGTDHAGIATQLQVEKSLANEGLTREEIGREDFMQRTWDWKEKYGGIITQQIRRLGASCDWERERFTLDEGLIQGRARSIRAALRKGLDLPRATPDQLVTRFEDRRLATWRWNTAEEPGTLYYFKYMLADADEITSRWPPPARRRSWVILRWPYILKTSATQNFIGRQVVVPILGRRIPVIADDYVDREFGTAR